MSKKAVKKTAKKKTAAKKAAAATATPRREDIKGIVLDLPDISNWKLAAKVLKIKPFYQGPGALPFSCFQATQMNMFPPKKMTKGSPFHPSTTSACPSNACKKRSCTFINDQRAAGLVICRQTSAMKAGNMPSLENCDEREVELQDFVLGVAVGANARIRAQVNRRAMMLKSRIGVLLFVFGCCFTAHAQQGQFGNQPSYYSSPQDVQDRINELSKQSVIPKSELALSRELDHIDNEIFSANTELSKSANYKEWGKRLEELVGKIKTTQSALLKIDCQKTGEFLQAERDYYIAVSSLRSFMQSYPQLNTEALLPSRAGAMS